MQSAGVQSAGVLLDVRLLRLFDALYATRSVTRAARQLGQAQPTVSIWLGRLRQELGDPLFVRTSSGLEPTPRADALIGTARSAIEILQRLASRPKPYDPSTDERCFRICMTDASHVTLLPRLLGHMRTASPHARVEALQIDPETGARLQSGAADLALGLIPALEAGFYQQTLYSQDWVCLANRDHPRLCHRLTRAIYEAEAHLAMRRRRILASSPARASNFWKQRWRKRQWCGAWSCNYRGFSVWEPSCRAPT
jgi:DNA-binding transcriptional LysR family regulator